MFWEEDIRQEASQDSPVRRPAQRVGTDWQSKCGEPPGADEQVLAAQTELIHNPKVGPTEGADVAGVIKIRLTTTTRREPGPWTPRVQVRTRGAVWSPKTDADQRSAGDTQQYGL